MARLTDITLHDQFHPAEGQRCFQQRASYISELYWQCLHGYKPPKTSRISITLVFEQRPVRAWKVGAIAVMDQCAHAPTYDALPDPDKLRYLLNRLHEALGHLCQAFHWDQAVFNEAYQQVLERDLAFRFTYPEIFSRDGDRCAYLLLEKSLTITRLFACLDAEGRHVQALLHEGTNIYWYDPVYQLVNRGKWLTNDRFGVRSSRPYFQAWYSLQQGQVGTA